MKKKHVETLQYPVTRRTQYIILYGKLSLVARLGGSPKICVETEVEKSSHNHACKLHTPCESMGETCFLLQPILFLQ